MDTGIKELEGQKALEEMNFKGPFALGEKNVKGWYALGKNSKGQPTLGERNLKGQWALRDRHILSRQARSGRICFTDSQRCHKRI